MKGQVLHCARGHSNYSTSSENKPPSWLVSSVDEHCTGIAEVMGLSPVRA